MSNDFKVALVFPPLWLPEAPFLSTPVLTAYLKNKNIDVSQFDMNIEFWNYFDQENQIRSIFKLVKENWKELIVKQNITEHESNILTLIGGVIDLDEDTFLSEVTEKIIEPEFYRRIIKNISSFSLYNFLKKENQYVREPKDEYHDLLFSDISFSIFAKSSELLLKILSNNLNPYKKYFEENSVSKISSVKPAVIGFSIAAINQVIPSFTLAKILKMQLPFSHITIGGSWCTQVHSQLSKKLDSFEFIDSMIIYEGEEPLYQLCKTIESNAPIEKIPNLIYKLNRKVFQNKQKYFAKLNEIQTPDFDDLINYKYDSKGSFPLQTSRGCYWGKCTFCSYPLLEPKYKMRSVNKIVEDIKILKQKYHATTIAFTDALFSPHYCKKLSEELLNQKVQVSWIIFARFEKMFNSELIELMSRAGCIQISWGLESGSDRVLKIIDKSIDLTFAQAILENSSKSNLHNRVLVMYGHPTETFDEALLTVDFIKQNKSIIHSIAYGYYHPEFNTPIEELTIKYNFELKRIEYNDLSFDYEWASCLTEPQKLELENIYQNISDELGREKESIMLLKEQVISLINNKDSTHSQCIIKDNNGNKKKVISIKSKINNNVFRRFFEIVEN